MIGKIKSIDLVREMTEAVLDAAARAAEKEEEDPVRAIIKAYNEMDEAMMRVVDEHIERVRKSSERNKELFRKLALQKEIEKRQREREELFEEAAEAVERREVLGENENSR